MELLDGRPENTEGRLEKEIRVYDFLDHLGIEYKRVDHEPAFTMEVCEEIDKMLQATICKNLFLCNRQKTQFYLLMMPGDKPFKTKEITSQIGSARLSFASAEDMEKYLDIEPGAVSVMGLMNDTEHHGCHPCVNTSSLRMRTADVFGSYLDAVGHDMTKVVLTGEA